jgi:hypothetical protein
MYVGRTTKVVIEHKQLNTKYYWGSFILLHTNTTCSISIGVCCAEVQLQQIEYIYMVCKLFRPGTHANTSELVCAARYKLHDTFLIRYAQ